MIAIHFIDGRACPFFVCDECRSRITKPALAMAAWGEKLSPESRSSSAALVPVHVHKGRCLQAFEARLTERGECLMTDELREHVAFLLSNSRIPAAKRDDANLERDPGPRARLESLKADPLFLATVLQRFGAGESILDLARDWRIPRRAFCEWLGEQGRQMRPKPQLVLANSDEPWI